MASPCAPAGKSTATPLSLEVAIVGGGIAGLAAAITLRRAGHRVVVYEQSRFANEVGAAIHLAPNATRILLNLGFDPVRANCVENGVSTLMDGRTKARKTVKTLDHIRSTYGYPWYLIHRVDLHNELKRLAFEAEGIGSPAVLMTSFRVVAADCESPSITFEDGSIKRPDLVIAADGVHSALVHEVTGKQTVAHPTGFSAYRFLVPVKNLLEDPKTRWLVKDQPVLMATFSCDQRRLAVYPCRKELMNFVAIHPQKKLAEGAREDWTASANIDGLLDEYSDFHPEIRAFCKLGPLFRKWSIGQLTSPRARHAEDLNDLKLWQLLYRPPIRPWTKGKLCLVGDAVHPMLPHQGQGGGMALEDAACLGAVLANLTSTIQISERFHLFELIRFERVSVTQILSNTGFDELYKAEEEAKKYTNASKLPKDQADIHDFFFSYDVAEHSKLLLDQFKEAGENKI